MVITAMPTGLGKISTPWQQVQLLPITGLELRKRQPIPNDRVDHG